MPGMNEGMLGPQTVFGAPLGGMGAYDPAAYGMMGLPMMAGTGGLAVTLAPGVVLMTGTPGGEQAHIHLGGIHGPAMPLGPIGPGPMGPGPMGPDPNTPDPNDPHTPDPNDPFIPVNNPVNPVLTPVFNEVVTATTGNDSLEGGSGNTNFTMTQGTTLGGTDTVADQGGTDQMTFEYLNNANLKVEIVNGGTTVAYVKQGLTYDSGTAIGQVSFTNIENLYVQDSVAGAAEKLQLALTMSGTGIAMAGTSGNDTIDISAQSGYLGSQIWGQGGVDTITGGAAGDTIYGGVGADVITGGDGQDRMYGGAGADDFKFVNQNQYGANQAASKHDWVYGFTTTSDELKFSGANFTGVANNDTITRTTAADGDADLVVRAGITSAGHANQRFLYNSTTGELFYDGDGSTSTLSPILITLLLNAAGNAPAADVAAVDIDIIA